MTVAQAKVAAAEARALAAEAKATDMRIESDLGAAGFLQGLEGEARSSQFDTLKALTGLSLVQEEGNFSIDLFSQRFGGMKPAIEAVPVVLAVVDLGGNTPPPTEQKASRKQELLKLRNTAIATGDRFGVLAIESELCRLK